MSEGRPVFFYPDVLHQQHAAQNTTSHATSPPMPANHPPATAPAPALHPQVQTPFYIQMPAGLQPLITGAATATTTAPPPPPPPPPKPQATPSATATATGSVIPPQGAAQQTHGSMAYYNPQTQGSASYSTPGNPSSSPGTGYSINQMGPNRQLQSTATCSGSGQVVGNKSPEDEDSLQLLKFGDFSSNTKYKDASGNIYVKLKSEDYSKPEIFKTLTGQTPKSSVNINECTAKRSLVYPGEKDEGPSPSASTGTLSSGTPPIDPIPTKSASKSPSGKPLQAPLSTEHTTDG